MKKRLPSKTSHLRIHSWDLKDDDQEKDDEE